MRFIHIADIHLGMIPDAGKPWSAQRGREIRESFYEVLSECNARRIDLLLIAGDLFHKRPRLKDLKELDYAFSKLVETKVVIIAGNHDYIGPDSPYLTYRWASSVLLLGEKSVQSAAVEAAGAKIYGFSFESRTVREQRISEAVPDGTEYFHILLAHGGEENYAPADWNKVDSAGFDYVAMGHIHKPGKITERIMYAGSLEPLDRNETGAHGFIYGELERTGAHTRLNTEFVPFSRRQYREIAVEAAPDMAEAQLRDRIREEIGKAGGNHIYKVILSGFRSADMVIDAQEISLLGNIVQLRDETKPDYDFEVLWRENRQNLIGLFIETIRKSGVKDEIADKALYYGIEALLQEK